MTETRGRRRARVLGLSELVGADVEVRTIAGASIRGQLVGVEGDWLAVEKAAGGRLAFLRVAAVASVQDERAPGLRAAGRQDAGDAVGGGE